MVGLIQSGSATNLKVVWVGEPSLTGGTCKGSIRLLDLHIVEKCTFLPGAIAIEQNIGFRLLEPDIVLNSHYFLISVRVRDSIRSWFLILRPFSFETFWGEVFAHPGRQLEACDDLSEIKYDLEPIAGKPLAGQWAHVYTVVKRIHWVHSWGSQNWRKTLYPPKNFLLGGVGGVSDSQTGPHFFYSNSPFVFPNLTKTWGG